MKFCIAAVKCFILGWCLYLRLYGIEEEEESQTINWEGLEGSGHGLIKVL